jgi:dimethylargininase
MMYRDSFQRSPMKFTHAILRTPAENFASGLTTADLGTPDYQTALAQHQAYCRALQDCGLALVVLPPDPRHPDSTFVEDTAILTPRCAILTNPGAESRRGEVSGVRLALLPYYESFYSIAPPGTVDGGDVCEADGHFFIGLSERTNEPGARQLAGYLESEGYNCSLIPATGIPGLLHLKSGIAYLGDGNLVLVKAFADLPPFQNYRILCVPPEEAYAANCLRVNDRVLVAKGFPRLRRAIEDLGYATAALEMSEFQKMDGGLSCLSLRLERPAI